MKGQALFKQCNGFFFVKNQIVVSRKLAFTFTWLTIRFPVNWFQFTAARLKIQRDSTKVSDPRRDFPFKIQINTN